MEISLVQLVEITQVRFLFTFWGPANGISVDESEEKEFDGTVTRPQTRFERLCDQILDAAMHPRKQKKQVRKRASPAIPIKGRLKNGGPLRIFLTLFYTLK